MDKDCRKANKADILVEMKYPARNREKDKVFHKQLREVSQSLALFLMADFTLSVLLET